MNGTKMLLQALFCLFLTINAWAQTYKPLPKSALIEPYRLEVACTKTTHLVFPFAIVSVDRGSENILAQKAAGVENILRVKGGMKNFEQTSLGVITSDGKLYSFLIDFCPTPTSLNINLENAGELSTKGFAQPVSTLAKPPSENEALLQSLVKRAESAKASMRLPSDESFGASIKIEGLYIRDHVLLLRLFLNNNSVINYDIDQLRLFIRDKKGGKRTAVQEQELQPIYKAGDTSLIGQKSGHAVVLALPTFTIPNGKFLAIEMSERNGGRNLFLRLKNKHILRAKLFE